MNPYSVEFKILRLALRYLRYDVRRLICCSKSATS